MVFVTDLAQIHRSRHSLYHLQSFDRWVEPLSHRPSPSSPLPYGIQYLMRYRNELDVGDRQYHWDKPWTGRRPNKDIMVQCKTLAPTIQPRYLKGSESLSCSGSLPGSGSLPKSSEQ